MSRPLNLQRRLNVLMMLPALIGGVAFGAIAFDRFMNGAPIVDGLAAVAVVFLVVWTAVVARRTATDVRLAIQGTVARGEALATGEQIDDEPDVVLAELAPVHDVLQDLGEQQRLIQEESAAANSDTLDELRETEEQLRETQEVTASIMDNVSDAIVVVDDEGSIVASNAVAQVALDLFGGSLDDAIPGWRDLPVGEHDFSRTLSDGTLTLTQVATTRMTTGNGAVTMMCWRDVSGERAVQAQIAHVALTDIVTGLPNRQGLLSALDRLHELGRTVSVIHVDLSEFGQINQRHGFPAGDHVLQVLSERLNGVIRDQDTVARVAGDEFVFIVDSHGDIVDSLARRILERIREPIALENGANVSLGAHAGWSTGLVDAEYELLRRATYALAEAKKDPESVSSYTAEIAQRDANRRDWEHQLRRAITNNEFVLFAQPIVDIFERRVLGVEIFLRWQHPTGRLISPAEFIEVAEESELIADIDRWVISRCISEAAIADPNLVFSLNVSNRFMAGSQMADFVQTTLAETALPAGRIQIDVTETNVSTDAASVVESIRRLNEMGVKVALDDFGSGYSSLAHLLKLAISTIKIDRRMTSMVGEAEGRGVVAAILAFARKRKLTVVAEGVETEQEVAELAELGCRYQQGYYHARPAPLAEVLASLDAAGFQQPGAEVVADVLEPPAPIPAPAPEGEPIADAPASDPAPSEGTPSDDPADAPFSAEAIACDPLSVAEDDADPTEQFAADPIEPREAEAPDQWQAAAPAQESTNPHDPMLPTEPAAATGTAFTDASALPDSPPAAPVAPDEIPSGVTTF